LRRFTMVRLLVVLALIALVVALLVPAIERARSQADLALCKDHLRQIGQELTQYARINDGSLPVSATIDGPQPELLAGLTACRCLGDSANYYCPAQRTGSLSFSDDNFKAGVIGYYYYSATEASTKPDLSKFLRQGVTWPRKLASSMDPKTWVMSDIWISGEPTVHSGFRKGVNYLMLDGSVDFIGESPRQAFH
jgi:prepilin-type processing-associated H-X9-DG protein